MNIVVVGSGYVGLVTGCCLAEAGHRVICVDHDIQKASALSRGRVPFHEPGLEALLQSQLASGMLSFDTRIARAMPQAEIVFLAVGTPPMADGKANLDNLLHCTRELADTAFRDGIVVIKSTVPVGTGDLVEAMLNQGSLPHLGQPHLRVVSNPEFLAEGRAIHDFKRPERIVIGTKDQHAAEVLRRLYQPFVLEKQFMVMDRRSAEFAKYACNAMLAARISVVNELATIAGGLGAEMTSVCRVIGTDSRIGNRYLDPGIGYGGSCLPKDLDALIHAAQDVGEPASLLRSVQAVNRRQGERLLHAIDQYFQGNMVGRRIAIWGLSFKPDTDDVREAPSLVLIRALLECGAVVKAYDPVAGTAAQSVLGDSELQCVDSAMAACQDADALVLMTEWNEFRQPDFAHLTSSMRGRMIFDARGIYDCARLRQHGFAHFRLDAPAEVYIDKPAALTPEKVAESDDVRRYED